MAGPDIGDVLSGRGSRGSSNQMSMAERTYRNERINMLYQFYPSLTQDPNQVQALAMAPNSTSEMMEAALSAVGTTGLLEMIDDLKSHPKETQYAAFQSYTPAQQAAMQRLGYQPPALEDVMGGEGGGWFSGLNIPMSGKLRAIGDAIAFDSAFGIKTPWADWANDRSNFELGPGTGLARLNPLSYIPLGVGYGVRNLLWLGESGERMAQRLYRTAQLYTYAVDEQAGQTGEHKQADLSGFDASAGWSPRSIWRAWNTADNGELVHTDESVNEAADILNTSNRAILLNDVSSDLWLTQQFAAGYSDMEIAEARGYEPGSPQFNQAVAEIYNQRARADIREAWQVLDRGKLNLGRRAAALLGMDDGSWLDPIAEGITDFIPLVPEMDAHTVTSGSIDALFLWRADPTMVIGRGVKAARAQWAWQARSRWTTEMDAMQDIAGWVRRGEKIGMDEFREIYHNADVRPLLMRGPTPLHRLQRTIDLNQARNVNRQLDAAAEGMRLHDEVKYLEDLKAAGADTVDFLRIDTVDPTALSAAQRLGRRMTSMVRQSPIELPPGTNIDDALNQVRRRLGEFMQDHREVMPIWQQAFEYHTKAKSGALIDLSTWSSKADVDDLDGFIQELAESNVWLEQALEGLPSGATLETTRRGINELLDSVGMEPFRNMSSREILDLLNLGVGDQNRIRKLDDMFRSWYTPEFGDPNKAARWWQGTADELDELLKVRTDLSDETMDLMGELGLFDSTVRRKLSRLLELRRQDLIYSRVRWYQRELGDVNYKIEQLTEHRNLLNRLDDGEEIISDIAVPLRQNIDRLDNPEAWWDFYRTIDGRKALMSGRTVGINPDVVYLPRTTAMQEFIWQPTRRWARAVLDPGKGLEAHWGEFADELNQFLAKQTDIASRFTRLSDEAITTAEKAELEKAHKAATEALELEFDELLNLRPKANYGFISMRVRDAGYEKTARALGALGRPGQEYRRFIRSIGHYVPENRFLDLDANSSIREFEKLAQAGALGNLPQQYIDELIGSFATGNIQMRTQIVKMFTADVMLRSGFLQQANNAGWEVWNRFVRNMDQAYGITGSESTYIGGVESRAGNWVSPLAGTEFEHIIMTPDFRQLAHATRHVNKLRHLSLGLTHMPMVDNALQRFWKPAQLLRVGFIPRAAGEEMISFMLRRGFREYFGAQAAMRAAGYRRLRSGAIVLADEFREATVLRIPNWFTHTARKMAGMTDDRQLNRAMLELLEDRDFAKWDDVELGRRLSRQVNMYRDQHRIRSRIAEIDEKLFEISLNAGDALHRLGMAMHLPTKQEIAQFITDAFVGEDAMAAAEHMMLNPAYQRYEALIGGATFDPYRNMDNKVISTRDFAFRDVRDNQLRHIPMRVEVSQYTAASQRSADLPEMMRAYSGMLNRMHNDPTGEALMRVMANHMDQSSAQRFWNTASELFDTSDVIDPVDEFFRLNNDIILNTTDEVMEELHYWARTRELSRPRSQIVAEIQNPDVREVVRSVMDTPDQYDTQTLIRLFSPNTALMPDVVTRTEDQLRTALLNRADYELTRLNTQDQLRAQVKAGVGGTKPIVAPLQPGMNRVYMPMIHRNDLAGIDQLFQDPNLANEFLAMLDQRIPAGRFGQDFTTDYLEALARAFNQQFLDRTSMNQLVNAAELGTLRGRDWIPLSSIAISDDTVAQVITDTLAEFRRTHLDLLDEAVPAGTKPVDIGVRWSYVDIAEARLAQAPPVSGDIARHGPDVFSLDPTWTTEATEISDAVQMVQVKLDDGTFRFMPPDQIMRGPHRLNAEARRIIKNEHLSPNRIIDEFFGEATSRVDNLFDESGTLKEMEFALNRGEIERMLDDGLGEIDRILRDFETDISALADEPQAILNYLRQNKYSRNIVRHLDDDELVMMVNQLTTDPTFISQRLEVQAFGRALDREHRLRTIIDDAVEGTKNFEVVQTITGSGMTEELGRKMLAQQLVDEAMGLLSTYNRGTTPRDDVLFEVLDGFLTDADAFGDPNHILRVAHLDDLPGYTFAPRIIGRNEATWDRIVRFGFDEVITPAIASLARTPHYQANVTVAMRQLRPMLDEIVGPEGRAALANITDPGRLDNYLTMAWNQADIAIDNTWLQNQDDVVSLIQGLRHGDEGQFEMALRALDLVDEDTAIDARRLMDSMNARRVGLEEFHQSVASRAYELTIPFIDDHRIRSQFQEMISSWMPFWFAEEQFLRRWARGFIETPHQLRKGQLIMNGMRHMGMIRQDSYGNEVFVYPGSEVAMSWLGPALARVYGGEAIGGVFSNPLTARTEYMFPGLRSDPGRPEYGPIVALGLNQIANAFPEFSDLRDEVLGDLNANRFGPGTSFVPEAAEMLMPSAAFRLFRGAFLNDFDAAQLRSAEVQAIAYLEANDLGPGPGATEIQMQEYLDKVNGIARTILLTRAATGFFGGAGADLQLIGLEEGISEEDTTALEVSQEFRELINAGLPIPDAIDTLVERHGGWVTPFTVFSSQSTSGAPIPATASSLDFMQQNTEFIEAFPNVAPWFLPQERPKGEYGITERRARNEAISMGLRDLDTPEEFLREIYFARAAEPYFEAQERYRENRLALESMLGTTNHDSIRRLDDQWEIWAKGWRQRHPVFSADMEAGTSRVRREKLLTQMQTLLAAPEMIPEVSHREQMIELMEATLAFQTRMEGLSGISGTEATEMRRRKREGFYWYAYDMVQRYPELAPFFSSVIRPIIGTAEIQRIEFGSTVGAA